MTVVLHKTFVGEVFYWGFKPLNYYREQIRQQAEDFINKEVGAENVVSIQETVTSNGPFSVLVWCKKETGGSWYQDRSQVG